MRAFSLMRIAGIRVVIDPSWLLIFALISWSLAVGYFPAASPELSGTGVWILSVAAALLLFASVLVHELSHAVLARRAGIQVPRIRLFLFGGVSEMASEPSGPGAEFRIAVAGPLTSLGLAVLFWIAAQSGLLRAVPGGPALLDYLASINAALGIFNLLPGFPLDGGRILRAWLWARRGDIVSATRTAGRSGSLVGYGLMGVGIYEFIQQNLVGGLWLVLIGIFLNQAAGSSYQTTLLRDVLSGIRVRALMKHPVITVPEHASLDELVTEYLYRNPHGSFPVATSDGRLAGMVSVDQLKPVPREDWIRTPVRAVMTSADRVRPLHPEEDCLTALERMIRADAGRLPVLENDRIIGILSRRDLMRQFEIRKDLRV
jgi:Zn-dependent protease